ncbi:MAG: acyl-CoA dehydrogenase family protein [Alphaproteobacteria bacterium]|nr:acyl-CoA dehydrogenase family protein [Alphaproteobacteria bacterium]
MTTLELDSPLAGLSGDAYRTAAREWLARNAPQQFLADRAGYTAPTVPELKRWEAALYRGGLAGIAWPSSYGGHGRTLAEHLIGNQEIGRLALPESVNSIGKELAGEAGSDLAGLCTRATPDGDGWRIDGQKIWTSGAMNAQRCLLLARTGPVSDRHRGLALFAVRMDSPGLRVRPLKQANGKEGFCEVFFDGVYVAPEDALGKPDEGWAAAIRVLSIERATNRMYRAWRFENELRHLIAAAKCDTRLAALLDEADYRQRIAATFVDIEVVKGYVEPAVAALVAGDSIGARGSLMKLHWSEAHQRFAALAMELLAQASPDAPPTVRNAQRHFRDIYLQSRAETIYAGTTEIQLGIIADRILELPRGR